MEQPVPMGTHNFIQEFLEINIRTTFKFLKNSVFFFLDLMWSLVVCSLISLILHFVETVYVQHDMQIYQLLFKNITALTFTTSLTFSLQ